MFIFLSKFLPLLIYPLGLSCVLIVLALFTFRRPKWQRVILLLTLVLLLVSSSHPFAYGLARSLEWRYLPPTELPDSQVIVVLGGGTLSPEYPRQTVEINGAGDRVIYAAWLYKRLAQQGEAPRLLLSGGRIEWLSTGDSPAKDMASLLELMGVPSGALWFENTSRNTYENAVNSRAILEAKGIRSIILVTSALHMPRSVGVFEKQGLQVIPAPTDYYVTQAQGDQSQTTNLINKFYDLLPSVENLSLTSRTMKEYIGLFIYRLRGWL